MRFMMIVKSPPSLEQSKADPKEFEAMGRYNEELIRAGVLLDLNGLAPSAKGAKVSFKGAERTVIDGPFAEAKEMVAGYWIIEVRSLDEAVAWAKRAPFSTEVHPGQDIALEIRQIMEAEDLPPERAAARKAFEESKR